jgi:hypothetical protein
VSSIDSPDIIRTILENNGTYPGDPQCFSILSYTNAWGGPAFALTYSQHDTARYAPSEFIQSPRVLWTRAGGLTAAGVAFLHTDGESK